MNSFLETGISLVFIFFIFSVIAYVLQELIAVNLKYRSKMLWKSMAQLFDSFALPGREKLVIALPGGKTPNTDSFYAHGQIASLRKNLTSRPFYIPAANFALAVMDLIAKKAPAAQNDLFKDFQAGLKTFISTNGNFYEVLKNLADTSANSRELQEKIEKWFNEYMNRVTGWYQSHTVVTLRFIAVGLAIFFNINVIKITKMIYKDGQLRGSIVAMSEKVVDHPESIAPFYARAFDSKVSALDSSYAEKLRDTSLSPDQKAAILREKSDSLDNMAKRYTQSQITGIRTLTNQLDVLKLPLGWRNDAWKEFIASNPDPWISFLNILLTLVGWAIAACCISMGAPFWFDMLGKLVNVRRSGVKPGDTKENKT